MDTGSVHGGSLQSCPLCAEMEESSHFVVGAILYRTLGLILPPPRWVHG